MQGRIFYTEEQNLEVKEGALNLRILILAASTGGGHIKASHAIESYLRQNMQDAEVEIIDTLKCIHTLLDKTVCDGYKFLAKNTPRMYGKLYQKTNEDNMLSGMVPKLNAVFAQKLFPSIEEYGPDLIIATHPFAVEMVSALKEEGKIQIPLLCVITDYGMHRAWIADHVDAYVVSDEGMLREMTEAGIPKEKVYAFGIPVQDVFFQKQDKEELLRELGLNEKLPTVLIMAGSFGVSNIVEIYKAIQRLSTPLQILLITGRNRRMYDVFARLIPQSPKSTRLIFYTNEVAKYMHVSDLLITKPGGLTISEALACSLPLVVFDAIPGQEEDNAEFLMAHNMGIRIKSGEDCAQTVQKLLEDSNRLENMRASCRGFDKSESGENIFRLVQSLLGERLPAIR